MLGGTAATRRNPKKKGLLFHETGSPNQCQCMAECPHKSLPGKAFCAVHLNSCPRVSPLTGAEPVYEPSRWNLNEKFKKTHKGIFLKQTSCMKNIVGNCVHKGKLVG